MLFPIHRGMSTGMAGAFRSPLHPFWASSLLGRGLFCLAGVTPAGVPKGFPLALWKPSGVLFSFWLSLLGKRGHACGHGRGFPLAPASFGYSFFFLAFFAWQGGMPAGMAGAFRSPFGNLRVSFFLFGFLCLARGGMPAGMAGAFRSPLHPSGSPVYNGGSARGVALGYRKVVLAAACGSIGPQSCPPAGDPSRVPACLVSWRQGKFATRSGFIL